MSGSGKGAMLDVRDIQVAYPTPAGPRVVVDGLSLALVRGEVGCLLGPSGCGKTTVLRAIAGFEPLQAGSVSLDGRPLSSPALTVAPEQRGIGMMFQDYALFPHLDVARNVGFGLSRRPRREREARVAEVLELVGLPDRADAWPHELSGGQQQRVALARALAPSPSLLLLDEPFSNLDIDTREHLAAELRSILRRSAARCSRVSMSRLENGSSSSSSEGDGASARASATRCCWPPDSSCGQASARSGRPTSSSTSATRASRSRRGRRARPKPTLAATSRCGTSA